MTDTEPKPPRSRTHETAPASKLITILLLLATLLVLGLQVARADNQPTQTEIALFSVLQFVFSLGFGWLLTRLSTKQEFEESQRQFAIAAYRRIREIDSGVERLLARLRQRLGTGNAETKQELEVALAIALGVRASIKSSIADWGDVIGEEIITIERIANIRSEVIPGTESNPRIAGDQSPETRKGEPGADDSPTLQHDRVEELIGSLPPSLRILESQVMPSKLAIEKAAAEMRTDLDENGFVELRGFWDDTFPATPEDLQLGSVIRLSVNDVAARTGVLTAHNAHGQPIGVLLNRTDGEYDDLKNALEEVFERSVFDAQLYSIERVLGGEAGYFRVRIDQSAVRIRYFGTHSGNTEAPP